MARLHTALFLLIASAAIPVSAQLNLITPDLAKVRSDAEKGDAAAQAKYGHACYGAFRYEEAVRWYRLAAEQGLAQAQRELGTILLSGCSAFPGRSGNVPADPVLGVKWLTLAAAQRDELAIIRLGQCHEKGRGVAVDLLQAYKWYTLASDRGSIMGQVLRNELVLKLTSDQIAQGDQLVAAEKNATPSPAAVKLIGIELKGISGNAQRRFALINNRTFAVGDEDSIKVGGQQVRVKCHEIAADSVLISVGDTSEKSRISLSPPR